MKSKIINVITTVALVVLFTITILLMQQFNVSGDSVVGDTTSVMFGVIFLAIDVCVTFIFMLLSIFNIKSNSRFQRNYSLIIDFLYLVNIILCVIKIYNI